MENLNFILEQLNGATSILTFCLLVFLTFYLWDWLDYKSTTPLHAILIGLPPAIALAAILYIDKIGTLMTRATAWVWRMTTGGTVPFGAIETGFLIGGGAVTTVSTLLMINLLTRPRFGPWPWRASALLVGGYVTLSTLAFLWR